MDALLPPQAWLRGLVWPPASSGTLLRRVNKEASLGTTPPTPASPLRIVHDVMPAKASRYTRPGRPGPWIAWPVGAVTWCPSSQPNPPTSLPGVVLDSPAGLHQ